MPDYIALVKFLVEPMLEQPGSLRIDCEKNSQGDRFLIRVAFDPMDKGRIFGRGGRTIQAIRTLVQTAGQNVSQTVRFDVFDPNPSDKSDKSFDRSDRLDHSDRKPPRSQDRSLDRNPEQVKVPIKSPIKLKPKSD